jgi:O-antigen ligase
VALAAEAPTAQPTARRAAVRLPAVAFVVIYCFLLLCVPSKLIVGPLGAPGTPANLWGLAALLWWLCATVGGLNTARRLSPVRVAAGVLAVSVFASYASATAHGWYAPPDVRQITDELWTLVPVTVTELNSMMISAADRGLLAFAGWVGIALLTADGLRSWRDLDLVVTWVSWLAAFVATLGIIQFATGLDIASFFNIPGLVANAEFGTVDTRSDLHRVASTANHPIEFGVVMAAVFPLALHRAIYSSSRWMWVPAVLIGVAIPMSVSRSAIITLGVAGFLLFIGWPNRRRMLALIIAPLAVVAMRLMAPGLVGTIISLFKNFFVDPSVTGRTDDYGVILALYAEQPWLGRGLFTFLPRYYRILDNQALMLLLELGLVGLIATSIFFMFGYLSARDARRWALTDEHRHLALTVSACIPAIVISYATFDAWAYPMAAGLSFWLVGLAGAAWRMGLKDSEGLVSQSLPVPGETEQARP